MTDKQTNPVDEALDQVDKSRRGFLKGLLIATASITAVPLLKTTALAHGGGGGGGGGKGKGKGKKRQG